MAKDDFDVIAYKILAYAYACLKQGVAASTDKACEVAKVNEVYFFAVLESLIDEKLIRDVNITKDMDGNVILYSPTITLTLDGARYIKENSRMTKVRDFLGKAFEHVLKISVDSTMAL